MKTQEVCILKNKLNILLTQILNEQTLVTPSSIHHNDNILPIEVPYNKVLSIQYILTSQGILERDGNIVYLNPNIIDAFVINNLIYIQLKDQFLLHNTNTQEQYVILNNMNIESFAISYPKVAIESSYYYIFDDKTRSLIKVGNTEKKQKIGCAFYQSFLFCGRPNGILWKAKMTGEVQSSFKFAGLKFNQINIVNNYLYNINQNVCTIILIDDMTIFTTIELTSQQIFFSKHKLLYFDQDYLYTLQILNLEDAFNQYALQSDPKAIELFKNHTQLQTYQNGLLLYKYKSNDIDEILQNLQREQFKFKFVASKNLIPNKSQIQFKNDINPKQCCQWLAIDPIISNRQEDLSNVIDKINSKLFQYKGMQKLRKYLNVKQINNLNMLHSQIIKNIKVFKKWELLIIQQNFKYCRNLNLEHQFCIQLIREQIKWRNKQLEDRI
ncbi:unnamed protein product [Paramecium sonneborni]|uniref:Uncharacterized protein n=1 Tax=Paramecium sonneborni TaxID=65129 RepID=A0A8S1L2R6_9CILI|nr:unnamed protein product [Paramecium sonneborni]